MPPPYASPVTTPPPPDPVPVGTDPTEWWNADPVAGFWEYLRRQGLNSLDPVSKFAQSQYGSVHNQYTAAAANDPTMGFFDYLNGANLNFQDQYANLTPEQRGDPSGRTHVARARWVTPR